MLMPTPARPAHCRTVRGVALAAGLCLATAAAGQTPPGSPPASIMIVFDASGSMWGRIDGERSAKFVVAREALRTSLPKLPPESRIGLTLFGHRRQGDCTDTQVVLPLESDKVERHLAPLEKLNPKGRGPIASALKEAAKVLGTQPMPRSLILIHDDQDNCQGDPCAALAELQAAAPGVVVNVIGAAVKDDPQRFLCLTRPTGGRLVEAQTAPQLQQAVDEVVLAATAMPQPQIPSAATAPTTPQSPSPAVAKHADGAPTRRPLATDGPPALRLLARPARGKLPEGRAFSWTVTAVAPPAPIAPRHTSGQDLTVEVPPGIYDVRARDGTVTATQRVTVPAKGETPVEVTLDAGYLALKFADGPEPPRDALASLSITVMELDVSAGEPKPLGLLTALDVADTGGLQALPPGNYVVRLQKGALRVDRPVVVASGATVDLDATLGAGQVTIQARTAFDAGRPPSLDPPPPARLSSANVLIRILEDDPDAPAGRKEVARASSPTATFTLLAGTYTVSVTRGSAETRERLAVRVGSSTTVDIPLQSARVTFASPLLDALTKSAPSLATMTYRLTRLDVVPPETLTGTHRERTIELAPGRYRIDVSLGNANARQSFDLVLGPGSNERLMAGPAAAKVALKFAGQPPPIDLNWEVRTAAGALVYSSAQPNPSVLLLAGSYTVRAETRGRRFERAITVGTQAIDPVTLGD